jgi:hypothetical protein
MVTCLQEKLPEKLKRVVQETDELKVKIANSRLDINAFCDDIIFRVDIFTETGIERDKTKETHLNDQRNKWLQEIRDYEQECVKTMESTRGKLIDYLDTVQEWARTELVSSSSKPLGHDALLLSELNVQAEKHLTNLSHLLLQMKAFQLGGRQMMFIELTFDSENVIGHLEIKEMRLPSKLMDLSSSMLLV